MPEITISHIMQRDQWAEWCEFKGWAPSIVREGFISANETVDSDEYTEFIFWLAGVKQ